MCTIVQHVYFSLVGEYLALRFNWWVHQGEHLSPTTSLNQRWYEKLILALFYPPEDAARSVTIFQVESNLDIEQVIKYWFTEFRDRG